jgi:SAM-dependent methyltransferase
MIDRVKRHYEAYVYPRYNLLASVRRCDTYALNLTALWALFNGELPPSGSRRILLAGSGSFSPYPTAIANPDIAITALDLSRANLRRARLHCLLHGCTNVSFVEGNLLEQQTAAGPFGFVDCFGVLHHLPDPLAGLQAIERRLANGGILRIMVYSHGARRRIEAARRAFRLLGINDPSTAKRFIRKTEPASRLRACLEQCPDATFDAGLADALLHPHATTFRSHELMALVAGTTLTPLLFAHSGALPNIEDELDRLAQLEKSGELHSNFILYLGKNPKGSAGMTAGTHLVINPTLTHTGIGAFPTTTTIPPRLGFTNPLLDRSTRRLLRRFRQPVPIASLTPEEHNLCVPLINALFLVILRD